MKFLSILPFLVIAQLANCQAQIVKGSSKPEFEQHYYLKGGLKFSQTRYFNEGGIEESLVQSLYYRNGRLKSRFVLYGGFIHYQARYDKKGNIRVKKSYYYDPDGQLNIVEITRNGQTKTHNMGDANSCE